MESKAIRDPKMQAFLDAGGDNVPRIEYLVFLHEMKKLFIKDRGICGCEAPIKGQEFDRFVIDRVAAGVRYDVYSSRLVA